MTPAILTFIRDNIGPKWSAVVGFAAGYGISLPSLTDLLSRAQQYVADNPGQLIPGVVGAVLAYLLRQAPSDANTADSLGRAIENHPEIPEIMDRRWRESLRQVVEKRIQPESPRHDLASGLSPSGLNYFGQTELECKGTTCNCTYPGMNPVLMGILNTLREHFGVPVFVNSGYRCKIHNAEIPQASKTSFHMLGMAADIVVEGVEPAEVYAYLTRTYPQRYGFGLYHRFVHVDSRTVGYARKPAANEPWHWEKDEAA